MDITKLDFAAPMVSILGPKELLVNRSSEDVCPVNGDGDGMVVEFGEERESHPFGDFMFSNWVKRFWEKAWSCESRTKIKQYYMENNGCCCCLFIFMNLPRTVDKRKWYTMSICVPGDVVNTITIHLNQNRKNWFRSMSITLLFVDSGKDVSKHLTVLYSYTWILPSFPISIVIPVPVCLLFFFNV